MVTDKVDFQSLQLQFRYHLVDWMAETIWWPLSHVSVTINLSDKFNSDQKEKKAYNSDM